MIEFMKKHSNRLLRSAALIACVVTLISAVMAYRWMDGTIRNSYAVWWVADLIVLHLKSNNESWPRSWDDLRDDFDVAAQQSGKPWSFEELSRRVAVDWSLNTNELREAAITGSDFRAVWLSDGTNDHWESREPNRIIRDYLLSGKSDKQLPSRQSAP
jgi:DNA-directed RNA polymerase specialized sigma subunit